MKPTDAPTPRTDAAIIEVDVAFVGGDGLSSSPEKFVEPDFARQLERDNARLRDLLEQMLFAVENADETGYVTDVGFINLDELHDKVRAELNPAGRCPAEGKM